MINVAHLVQLKAFARQDALLLALLWAASFACIMMLNAGLIGNILALATPFLVGKRLAAFRTQALYGVISFRRAYAYSLYVFIYASLVFALVQYAYFQFLDNGAFVRAHHYNDEASSTRLRTERCVERRDQEQHGPHNDDYTRAMGIHVYDAKPLHRCDYQSADCAYRKKKQILDK